MLVWEAGQMTGESDEKLRLIISLLQQANKSLIEAVNLIRFLIGERIKRDK